MARTSRTIVTAIAALTITSVAVTAPATAVTRARPDGSTHAHGHALVDRNGDHLSDGLDARLRHVPGSARIDVVATFSDRATMRAARSGIGRARTTFSLIPWFAARLTPGQISSLSHRP